MGGARDLQRRWCGLKWSTPTLVSAVVLLLAAGVEAQDLRIAGQIAFMTTRDGAHEIYRTAPDGLSQIRLTVSSANEQSPSWSPDGTKIAFFADRDGGQPFKIYAMAADGTNVVRLTYSGYGDTAPVWSPDGSKIAFVSNRDGNAEIYTMNADGTGALRLTSNAAADLMPAWSPDGSRIAFYSHRDGNAEIYVISADGANLSRLTTNAADDDYSAWSPDGARIAFQSTRDGGSEIYVMNADGSDVTRLTNNSAIDHQPCWSPDGTRIAFYTNRDGNDEIYIMNADGTGQTAVSGHPASDSAPSWETPFRIGSTQAGTPVSRIIIIQNEGSAVLEVGGITSTDGQFTATPGNFTVAPGGSQSVALTFTPTTVGTTYTTLTIASNDPEDPTIRLVVNGTGDGVLASLPDTIARYQQVLALPVRVTDTTGKGVVSAEVTVAYDGGMLAPGSPAVTTGAMTAGWTLESNVVQGSGTAIDTLRLALAHGAALTGSGDLAVLHFTMVRPGWAPATSALTLSQVLFNDGNPGAVADDGSVKLVGTDGSLASVPEWVYPRWPIVVTVIEADENWHSTLVDSQRVQVRNGAQTEVLTLAETGVNTGMFAGAISTVFSPAAISGDGVVQAVAGDTIRFAWTDSLDAEGNTVSHSDTTLVRGGHNASLRPTWVVQPGDTTRVRVVDADLSGTVGVTVGNPRSGEQDSVVLSQFAPGDSVFYGRAFTVRGTGPGSLGDSTVVGRKGDSLRVTYVDTLTALGGIDTLSLTTRWVDPFGDVDNNSQVQAYDAAKVLYHCLWPNLIGIDSLSANVDSLAPASLITPYDASLILRKVVRLIDRFPVQRPSAANQPQPESGLRPKAVPTERLLSLRPEGDYLSVWCADRSGILSGEVVLRGASGQVAMGEGLGNYLVAWREREDGLVVVFAGAQAMDGPGELMRLYGVGPGGIELARADFNDGQLAGATTAATITTATPLAVVMYPAWPNPFNPETMIGYELPKVTTVELAVYDALGQRVRVLASGTESAGVHQVRWDGRGQTGEVVGTGVYFCRLQAGDQVKVQRMVLLK